MTQVQIVYPLRSGMQERWRRLCQEVAGSHKEQFEVSCRRLGITHVQVRLLQLLHGELLFVTLQTPDPHQALDRLVSSNEPGDRWLRAQLQALFGWNPQDVLADPRDELILTMGQ